MPCTPTSPTGSHMSMALSVSSSNTVPIARTDKHVVLAMSPARPKVSSMQAKLDHTKIDTSLYEQVSTTTKPTNKTSGLTGSSSFTFCHHLRVCFIYGNMCIRCDIAATAATQQPLSLELFL